MRNPSSPPVEIRIARLIAEVEALRPVWSHWKTHRDSDLDFCLKVVWQNENFIRPHVLVLYRLGQPEALLVGRLERAAVQPKFGYLRLPAVRPLTLTFPHGGLLGNGSPENSELFIQSILESLRRGEADSAYLHSYLIDSPIYEKARRLPAFVARDHIPKPVLCTTMKIAEDREQVLAGFSSGLRADIRRKSRKLEKDFGGRAKFWTAHEASQLERVLPEIEEVARKSYQRGLGVGFEDTPQMRQQLRFKAEMGWLRIYLLSIDEKLCAYWIGTVYEGVFLSDYLSFDTRFGSYSPGTLLLMKMIEDFCATGIREINFGSGKARYKQRFGNSQTLQASVRIFAPKPRGLTLSVLHNATEVANAAARSVLHSTGLSTKIKQSWRHRSASKGNPE